MYKEQVYDGDLTQQIKNWGYPVHSKKKSQPKDQKTSNKSFSDKIFDFLFPTAAEKQTTSKSSTQQAQKNLKLEEQIKQFLQMSDDQYSESKLTSELRNYLIKQDQAFEQANANIKQKIAPSSFDIWVNEINISWMYARTYYVNSYPSVIDFFGLDD